MELECGPLTDCLLPIAGGAPAGVDARFDAEYERVRAELEKLGTLSDAIPDWHSVERLGSTLLRVRSKDLTVAVYLAAARLELASWDGFAHGCALLAGLIASFGEQLYPARARARANALDWLVEYASARLANTTAPSAQELAHVRGATHQLRDVACAAWGDQVPSFAALLRVLDRRALDVPPIPAAQAVEPVQPASEAQAPKSEARLVPPEAESPREDPGARPSRAPASPSMPPPRGPVSEPPHEPVPDPPLPASSGPVAHGQAHPVTTSLEAPAPTVASSSDVATRAELPIPTDERGIADYLRAASARMVALARARMSADARDPRAYRWLREALWLGWERAPATNRHGRTIVPPPPASTRAEIERTRSAGDWLALLRVSEDALVRTPHWLELSYLSALALAELGDEHRAARAAVERGARELHARIPELARLCFRDGSPFASPQAQRWLAPAPPAARAEPVAAATSEPDGIDGLLRSLQSAPSPRSLFVQRCQVARAFQSAGATERARFVYIGLLRDVDAHALEHWEPALAVEVLEPLCALLKAHPPVEVKDADPSALYARLARLAPWSTA